VAQAGEDLAHLANLANLARLVRLAQTKDSPFLQIYTNVVAFCVSFAVFLFFVSLFCVVNFGFVEKNANLGVSEVFEVSVVSFDNAENLQNSQNELNSLNSLNSQISQKPNLPLQNQEKTAVKNLAKNDKFNEQKVSKNKNSNAKMGVNLKQNAKATTKAAAKFNANLGKNFGENLGENSSDLAPTPLASNSKNFAHIRTLITRHVVYPPRAKRLRQSEVVVLKFELFTNGEVRNAHAFGKFDLLKKAALNALSKSATSFPKLSKNVAVELAIDFRLE